MFLSLLQRVSGCSGHRNSLSLLFEVLGKRVVFPYGSNVTQEMLYAGVSDAAGNAWDNATAGLPELPEVAEAPWSVAEWAVALRFDIPQATVLVLVFG